MLCVCVCVNKGNGLHCLVEVGTSDLLHTGVLGTHSGHSGSELSLSPSGSSWHWVRPRGALRLQVLLWLGQK